MTIFLLISQELALKHLQTRPKAPNPSVTYVTTSASTWTTFQQFI